MFVMITQRARTELLAIETGATRTIALKRIDSSAQTLRSSEGDVSDLKNSIARYGLLHPILVRHAPSNGETDFQVVSGRRRLQALKQLGIQQITCQVTNVPDKEAFEIALSENLQRRQLDPVEEALAFQHYLKVCRWGKVRDLEKKIGKSEEYINHRLKLLELPEEILSMIGRGLTPSHAEELSWCDDHEMQIKLAKESIERKLTVNQLHQIAMREKNGSNLDVKSGNQALNGIQASDRDWLPKVSKGNGKSLPIDRVLQNNILALKYSLSHLDSCIQATEELEGSERLTEFMIRERFMLHEVLDHFVSALTRARNGNFV